MAVMIKDHHASFSERGLTTHVFIEQGLDLTITQTDAHGNEARISHYSDPGISTYVALLKFLYMHKRSLPRPPKTVTSSYEDFSFRFHAEIDATALGRLRFPIKIDINLPGTKPVTLLLDKGDPLNPKLEIGANGSLIFSLDAARKTAEIIPRLYPDMEYFRIAQDKFLEEAGKHPEQVVDLKELRRLA